MNKKSDASSSEEEEPENLSYKIIIIGDEAVGKTQIVNRYCDDHFSKNYKKTIGVDFFQKRIELTKEINVSLQIWDVDGEAMNSKMLDTYVHDANAIVYVYDITNHDTFDSVDKWMDNVVEVLTKEQKDQPIQVLLGNKSDLNHLAAISLDKHDNYAKQN